MPIASLQGPVKVRAAGPSGLKLPVLGLGCWSFGGGEYWGPQDQEDVDAVVHRALDVGVTYFDTAEAYNGGASEISLGIALKGGGRRERAIIGTKISPHNATAAGVRAHCEASLGRLQTDVIDLYMVHWPINPNALKHFTSDPAALANPPSVPEAFATLMDLRREGKVRHIGVSNFGVEQLTQALGTGAALAVDQLPYSLLARGIELEILPFCRDKGVGVIGYMSLMQGLLSGKFESIESIPPARKRTRHFSGSRVGSRHGEAGLENETWQACKDIGAIAGAAKLPRGALSLAWAMANADITCSIVGCRDIEQLEDNLKALDTELGPDVLSKLNKSTADLQAKLGTKVDLFQGAASSRTF